MTSTLSDENASLRSSHTTDGLALRCICFFLLRGRLVTCGRLVIGLPRAVPKPPGRRHSSAPCRDGRLGTPAGPGHLEPVSPLEERRLPIAAQDAILPRIAASRKPMPSARNFANRSRQADYQSAAGYQPAPQKLVAACEETNVLEYNKGGAAGARRYLFNETT
jgi:hypothetical protein